MFFFNLKKRTVFLNNNDKHNIIQGSKGIIEIKNQEESFKEEKEALDTQEKKGLEEQESSVGRARR